MKFVIPSARAVADAEARAAKLEASAPGSRAAVYARKLARATAKAHAVALAAADSR